MRCPFKLGQNDHKFGTMAGLFERGYYYSTITFLLRGNCEAVRSVQGSVNRGFHTVVRDCWLSRGEAEVKKR